MAPIDPYTLTGNWNYPTSIHFGPGRIRELAQTCREAGITRPLLVSDPRRDRPGGGGAHDIRHRLGGRAHVGDHRYR